jgi:hypothetical protein
MDVVPGRSKACADIDNDVTPRVVRGLSMTISLTAARNLLDRADKNV